MTVRIGKIKLKSGGSITVLPKPKYNKIEIPLGDWGIVTCMIFEDNEVMNKEMYRRDALYMLESAKINLIKGE